MCSMNPQILTIFDTRREIYDNIQEILGIHERCLSQLQTASPFSAPQAQQAGASELMSRGITKRIGSLDLGSLKGLQQRSLRTRSLKASVNQRLMALTAEPTEGLEVARELGKLVSIGIQNRIIRTDWPFHSHFHSLPMTNSAATMNCWHKTLLSCAGQLRTGQYMTKGSRRFPSRSRPLSDADKRPTNQ